MDKKDSFPEYFVRRVLLMTICFIFCFFSAIALQAFLKKHNIHEIVGNTLFFYSYDQSHFYFLFLALFFFIWAFCFFYPRPRFAPIWEKVKNRIASPLLFDRLNLGAWICYKKILCWIFFSLLLLLVTYPALNYGLAWDDLHLIRRYSAAEIISTFTGNWDVDGVENPGYRPFMTGWYALLYQLFGEHFIYYRIFSALFIAFSYVLIIDLGRHFVRRWELILIGLTLAVFSHAQSLYIGFITESFRSLQLFCAVGSLWMLFEGLRKKNLGLVTLAFLLHTLGIYTREENTLFIIPIAALLYFYFYKSDPIFYEPRTTNHEPQIIFFQRTPFSFLFLLTLFTLPIILYWPLRYVFVPASTYFYDTVLWAPIVTFHATMSHYPFWGLPFYLFGATLCLAPQPLNRFFLLCLGLGIVSSSVSVSGVARPDASFYPILWFGLAAGIGLEVTLSGTSLQRWLGIIFLLLIFINGVRGNWMRMDNLHGMATHVMAGNAGFLYGGENGKKSERNYGHGLSQTVSIPDARYRDYHNLYQKMGYKGGDPKPWVKSLEKQAEKAKRFTPSEKKLPFKSRVSFFYYR